MPRRQKMTETETQLILVECVSTFRIRYMVEVPKGIDTLGNDKALWALDTVTIGEAREFSQEHIGEQIISHRVVSRNEALAMCDQENKYGHTWDDDLKASAFFTLWADRSEKLK